MMTFQSACFQLIQSGICKGDCCGPIPIETELIDRNKAMIQVPYEDLADGSGQDEMAYPMADDLHCIFLNRESYICQIYSVRPWLCRKFGDGSHPTVTCPRLTPDGELRTRAERKRIDRRHSEEWKGTLGRLGQMREYEKVFPNER